MSLGCVVVILAAVMPALKGRLERSGYFAASSLSWGYCTLFLWAPGTVTVLMSMQIFDLSWQSYFPPAFTLSLLGLGLGAVLALIRFHGQRFLLPAEVQEAPEKADWGKIRRLSLILAVIAAGMTGLEQAGFSSSTGRLLVMTLAVSLLWLLLQDKSPDVPVFQTWWEELLPKNGSLSCFFLAMGLFSGAIQYSGLSRLLAGFFQNRQTFLGPLVLPLLPAAVVLFSLAGLHPFVSVLMIGPILTELHLPASPLQLGLAMSLGCCLSYMLSPFAGLILALSGELEEPPARICLRSNLMYALLYYAMAMGAICLLPG